MNYSDMFYIFDIDGTLANNNHRQYLLTHEPKNWDEFFDLCVYDKPILPIINLAIALHDLSCNILCFTGRPERVRSLTEFWLKRHLRFTPTTFMRQDDDHRPDHLIKEEFLKKIESWGIVVSMVFDDRSSVVKMWRSKGLICAQVADGDF